MFWRYGGQVPKFGINSLHVIRENSIYGRTTTTDDGRPRDDSSSAVQQRKAELIIYIVPFILLPFLMLVDWKGLTQTLKASAFKILQSSHLIPFIALYLILCSSLITGIVQNKRPRGLDALLGHLLVKKIPEMYKLSTTKIPEYLSQEQIQGRQSWKRTE